MKSIQTANRTQPHALKSRLSNGNASSLNWIRSVFARGGPSPDTYAAIDAWVGEVAQQLRSGSLSRGRVDQLWESLGGDYLADSLQGRCFAQTRGYAGDFQTIDQIYLGSVSEDPKRARWDHYFYSHHAVRALRNRKQYFKDLVQRTELRLGHTSGLWADQGRGQGTERDAASNPDGVVRVLNIGSGPCRDVLEFFQENPDTRVHFTCVDQDADAIRFARSLCAEYAHKMEFVEANALSFKSTGGYDLVWSAGVMDYLNDRLAKAFLRRAMYHCGQNGEVVIGNFSTENPTRDYMELVGRWFLHHRTPRDLAQLADVAGARPKRTRIGQEAEGVNLFLHVTKN